MLFVDKIWCQNFISHISSTKKLYTQWLEYSLSLSKQT